MIKSEKSVQESLADSTLFRVQTFGKRKVRALFGARTDCTLFSFSFVDDFLDVFCRKKNCAAAAYKIHDQTAFAINIADYSASAR